MSSQSAPRKKYEIMIHNFPGYFLIACLLLSFLSLYQIFQPFLIVLILAGILATAFHPLYNKFFQLFRHKAKLAGLTTCLVILLLLVIPLLLFILLLGHQAFDTYLFIQAQLQNGLLDAYLKWQKGGVIYDFVFSLRGQLGPWLNIENIDLKANIADTAKQVTSFLASQSANILKGFGKLLFNTFILFFALYYFLKDGDKIVKKIAVISPLPEEHEQEIMKKFKEMSLASLYGIFLTSIVQGMVGGIGFAIAGIPNSLFWGTAIAVFSLVPLIGTAAIWLPASIILMTTGHFVPGIFLFLWGLLLVSTVDNFLRAFLIGGRTKMNQLLTFLAVFGGISVFGLIGVIFGPLILTLFFSFLHIYEIEYRNVLHKKKE